MPNALEDQDIELFRSGDYGDKGVYTNAHLDEMVANFDPSFHEPPNVVGHPDTDAPALGWIASLKRVGDTLVGRLKQVPQSFADAVASGAYKKRSIALYKNSNGYMVRHLGWLGAAAPEVKGLADVKFSDAGKGEVVEITFADTEEEMPEVNEKKIVESVVERFKELFAAKPAEVKTFSESDAKQLVADAVAAAVKPIEDAQKARDLEFAQRAAQASTVETRQRAEIAIARVKAKGAWVPAFDKAGLALVFAELAKTTETVEFGEGDAKQKVTPLEALTTFMEGLGKIVPAGRVVEFAESKKTSAKYPANADPNSVTLSELSKKRAAEKGIKFSEAMSQIASEQPELTLPGGATSGTV